jgi:flavodoxin
VKTLVVYYSRTGTTKKVAEFISSKLNCDLEEIVDVKSRKGVVGWLRSGMEATTNKNASINESKYDLASYDLVIVGTPIWNGRISSPMRTYLNQNKDGLRRAGFFCTHLAQTKRLS